MSTSGITFGGLSSGIDTDSIISRMMQLEQYPIQRLQFRQQELQAQQAIQQQLKAQVQKLSGAASGLNVPGVFNPMKAQSSDNAVALISTSAGVSAGTYNLQSYQLAKAEKLSSSQQSAFNVALGKTGAFTIGGKTVDVEATDTLTDLAAKINRSGADVTASILNGGEGNVYLTVTAKTTGASNRISMADTTGTVLSDLGLVGTSVRHAVANGAQSTGADSATATLADLYGLSGTSTIKVAGFDVAIDAATDTLTTLAAKIDALGGVSASVVTATEAGRTVHKLQIVGDSGTPAFVDDDDVLLKMGVLRRDSEIVAAQDALFALDGVALRSASNSVSSVIPGTTFTLTAADLTTPKTSTLTVVQDNDQTKSAIKAFVDAYNGMMDFIAQNSRFDTETYESGPLFGDSTSSAVESQIANLVFGSVAGVDADFSNLAQLGFTIGGDGKMTMDDKKLTDALNANPAAVAKLLQTAGTATGDGLSYISSGSATQASGGTAYNVEVTRAATRAKVTAFEAMETPLLAAETLTFDGKLFQQTPYNLLIPEGSTQQQVLDLINNDTKLKDLVEARYENDRLVVEAKRYGASGDFSIVSTIAADTNTTGFGTAGQAVAVGGLDIQGKINGETATGTGQYLTGNEGNATTAGLQILYSGTSTGVIGNIQLTKGIASRTFDLVESFISGSKSLFNAGDEALQKQIDDLSLNITDLTSRLTLKEEQLRAKFAAMEQAISRSRSQLSQMQSVMTTG